MEDPEICDTCLEKSEKPETECFEVSCKCDCHLTTSEKKEQEKIAYDHWKEQVEKERTWNYTPISKYPY